MIKDVFNSSDLITVFGEMMKEHIWYITLLNASHNHCLQIRGFQIMVCAQKVVRNPWKNIKYCYNARHCEIKICKYSMHVKKSFSWVNSSSYVNLVRANQRLCLMSSWATSQLTLWTKPAPPQGMLGSLAAGESACQRPESGSENLCKGWKWSLKVEIRGAAKQRALTAVGSAFS